MAVALAEVARMETRTAARQRAFLTAFRACGVIQQAAEMAGIDPSTHYRWLHDPQYAAAYNGARTYYERREADRVRRRAVAEEYDLVCPICYAYREIHSRLRYMGEDDWWECPLCKCKVLSPDDNLRALKEDMLAMQQVTDGQPPWRSVSPHMDSDKTIASTRRLRPGRGGGSGRKRKRTVNRRYQKPATLA